MFNGIRGKRTELTFAEQVQQKLSDAMYKTSRQNSVDIGTQALAEGYGLNMDSLDNEMGNVIQYDVKKGDQYRTTWTMEKNVLSKKEVALFYKNLSEVKQRGFVNYRTAADGSYIFEIENKLVYTDGNFKHPTISKVVTFASEYENENIVFKELIFDAEEQSDVESATEIIKNFAEDGILVENNFEDYLSVARSRRRGKREYLFENDSISPTESQSDGRKYSADNGTDYTINLNSKDTDNTVSSFVDSKNKKQFLIMDIVGKKDSYGKGVYLDTDVFKGTHPRNWNKVLTSYVYNNLEGKSIPVYAENGNAEVISFAKKNERVLKDGAKNDHRVIDELARARGNIKSLSIVHIDELLQTAETFDSNNDNTHQWLDQNGWEYKRAYVQDIKGQVFETTLNIAKTRDGRKILYALSNIKKVDDGVVPSASLEEGLARKHQLSDNSVSQNPSNVKPENDGIKQYMIPSDVDGDGEGYQPAGDLDMDAVYEPGQEQVEYLSELRPEFAKERTPERIQAEKQTVDAVKEYFQKEAEALGVEAFEPGRISDDAQAVPDSDMDEGLSLMFEDPAYFRSLIEDDPKRDRIIEFSEAEEKSAEGEALTDDKLVSDAQKTAENEASLAGTQRFADNDTKYKRRYLKTAKRLDDLLKDSDFSKVSDPEFRESAFKLVNGYRGDRLKTEKNEISSFFEAYGTLYSELHWATEAAKRVEKRLNFEGDMHRDAERIGEGTLLEQELSDAWTAEQREAILELGYALKAQNDIEKAIKEFSKGIHKGFYDFAEALLKDSDKFNDLKIGMKTLVSPDRIFKYVAGDTNANEKFERFVISRLQEHNGDVNRDLENMYVRFKAIGISRNKKGRNKVSEDYAIQWFGEAEGRVAAIDLQLKRIDKRYTETRKKLKEERDDINARITQFKLDNPDFDYDLLLQKKEKVQALYDDMYTRMNIVRMMHGYAPLPYLKNYFHHFMDAKTNFWGKLFRYNPGPDVQLPNKFYIHDIEIGADSNTAAVKGVTDVRESTPIFNLSTQQNAEEVNQKHILIRSLTF